MSGEYRLDTLSSDGKFMHNVVSQICTYFYFTQVLFNYFDIYFYCIVQPLVVRVYTIAVAFMVLRVLQILKAFARVT